MLFWERGHTPSSGLGRNMYNLGNPDYIESREIGVPGRNIMWSSS
jgi:hypothetical protein